MTAEEFLAGVESRLTTATPGPWYAEAAGAVSDVYHGEPHTPAEVLIAIGMHRLDAALIASAPSDLAKLTTKALGRTGISVDMSFDYCRLATWRTNDRNQLAHVLDLDRIPAGDPAQLDLFGEVSA